MSAVKSKPVYHPIACGYYDVLEVAAMHREVVDLVYQDFDGKQHQVKGFIENIWAKNGEEFLRMRDGLTIRLDQFVSVNGNERPGMGTDHITCGCG